MYTDLANDCRNVLLVVMAGAPDREFTTAELGECLVASGVVFDRRPGQKASDALRMPVDRGWVVRVRRGCYRFGRMPSTSLRRARRWVSTMEWSLGRHDRSAHANWRLPRPQPATRAA